MRKFLVVSFFTSLIVATPARAIDVVWWLNTPVEAPGAPFLNTVRVDLTQTAGGVLFDVTGVWPTSGFFSADTFLGELEFTFSGPGVPTLSSGSGTYLTGGGSAPVLALDNNDLGFDFGLNLAFQTANTPAGARFESGDNFSFVLENTTLPQFTALVSGPGSTNQFQGFALAHLQAVAGGGSVRYVAPIPEPETYAILLAGLAAAGFIAKRRRRPA